jgi:hypothetical protein
MRQCGLTSTGRLSFSLLRKGQERYSLWDAAFSRKKICLKYEGWVCIMGVIEEDLNSRVSSMAQRGLGLESREQVSRNQPRAKEKMEKRAYSTDKDPGPIQTT